MYSIDTPRGKFNDCLYFKQEDYDKLSISELERLKQERCQRWLDIVEAESNKDEEEPTEEELTKQESDLDQQIAALQSQKMEVSEKISSVKINKIGKLDNGEQIQA